MGAALKRHDIDTEVLKEEPAGTLVRAGAGSLVEPVASPARELQASLARRLERGEPSTSEVLTGLIVGVCGACWVTGILLYASL